jgi:hypothetical protein
VGAYGSIAVRRRGDGVIAENRICDADGRLRHVRVTARSAAQARQVFKQRLLDRPTFGSTRVLSPQSTSLVWSRCGWPRKRESLLIATKLASVLVSSGPVLPCGQVELATWRSDLS